MNAWLAAADKTKYVPIFEADQYMDDAIEKSSLLNFVMIDCYSEGYPATTIGKNIFKT